MFLGAHKVKAMAVNRKEKQAELRGCVWTHGRVCVTSRSAEKKNKGMLFTVKKKSIIVE